MGLSMHGESPCRCFYTKPVFSDGFHLQSAPCIRRKVIDLERIGRAMSDPANPAAILTQCPDIQRTYQHIKLRISPRCNSAPAITGTAPDCRISEPA